MIGAALKLPDERGASSALQDEIHRAAAIALGHDASASDMRAAARLMTTIEMALMESTELLHDPARSGGWSATDDRVLETQARASAGAFDRIAQLAGERPSLRRALSGTFLDVGTGAGGIALRAAAQCPALKVVGIDIWEPALALARRNVLASEYGDRIEIERRDVADLAAGPRFTLAWLPTMFMARRVVETAMQRIVAASTDDAWLVASLYTTPADPFAASMSRLRTLRSGGDITDAAELVGLFEDHGYIDVEIDVAPVATFILGRRPPPGE
ncbi:SAM-dependent methyltransferase [Sphingomonas sp. DT-51]|uniref:SAM-dependent methyltransferase n=1 Tax=Sphingomonas sp. DT-51 TaxID=3396165 RepID=UPI003F1DBC7B